MAGPLRLKVTLEPRGPAAAIVLTDDQAATLVARTVEMVRAGKTR